MKLIKNKYIKCFTEEKSAELQEAGFLFLYEKAGVYYHQNNEELVVKFSKDELLKDIKFSKWINL